MNLELINELVAKIDSSKYDDEVAHALEDNLRRLFITHIAQTNEGELGAMAKAILRTENIVFSRWCA